MAVELELYDVTIVGGGPAGLYAAFYSGMRDMKTKLIEAKDELGGRMLIYPEKMIWDVGGVTLIRCDKLIQQLIEQAQTFEPTIVLSQQAAGAFTDAALAVNGAKLYMDPKASTMAHVSSHNARFNEKNKALRITEEDA